jgi:hypothetical protein
MALIDDAFKGWSGLLIGVGAAYVLPNVLPVLRPIIRPMVKGIVRTGLSLADTVREAAAEAGEQLSDVVAEARSEQNITTERAVVADRGARTAKTSRRRRQSSS